MLTNQLHGQLQMLTHSITLTCTYVAHLTSLAIHTFTERAYCISVYNTCTLLLNNDEKYTISGNEPSSEMLTCQSQVPK